jgi:hypothetical protein
MKKKAQAQIITTVLIILLVLAAIVIVWQLVNSAVGGAAGEAESKIECAGISLIIKSIDEASNKIIVERKVGGTQSPIDIAIRVEGTIMSDAITDLEILEQGEYIYAAGFTSGDEIAIAPIVNEVQCDIVDTEIV